MPYATLQDLIDRFGDAELLALTDRADPPAGAVDAAVAQKGLDAAVAEIDGYLATRYALPLAVVPPLVRELACTIARYRLWKDGRPEAVRQDYEDASRQLRQIAEGTITLDTGTADAPTPTGGVKSVSAPRVFDAAGLRGFLP